MFLGWDGFVDRLIQIFGDLEVEVMAKWKISELMQKGLAIEYII